jgi:hypothetical protein
MESMVVNFTTKSSSKMPRNASSLSSSSQRSPVDLCKFLHHLALRDCGFPVPNFPPLPLQHVLAPRISPFIPKHMHLINAVKNSPFPSSRCRPRPSVCFLFTGTSPKCSYASHDMPLTHAARQTRSFFSNGPQVFRFTPLPRPEHTPSLHCPR